MCFHKSVIYILYNRRNSSGPHNRSQDKTVYFTAFSYKVKFPQNTFYPSPWVKLKLPHVCVLTERGVTEIKFKSVLQ